MAKISKKYIFGLAALLVIVFLGTFDLSKPNLKPDEKKNISVAGSTVENPAPPKEKVNSISVKSAPETTNEAVPTNSTPPPETTEKSPTTGDKVYLQIGDQNYTIYINSGDSAYDAMKKLDDAGKFSFHVQSYAGIGYYVDEINGDKEGGGEYWIYYINDCKPAVGISDYKLKAGDKILWRKETTNNLETCLKK